MWKVILGFIDCKQSSIDMEQLWNPDDVAVRYFMYVYSLETFLSEEIYRTTVEGDRRAARTLGPFCWVLAHITKSTQYFRKDKLGIKLPHELVCYRSLTLTKEQIDQYL